MITWNNFSFLFPSSPSMIFILFFHDFIMVIIFSILIFVLFGFIRVFFLKLFNLVLLENHVLEFIWTIIPFLILSFVIIFSISTLYFSDSCLFCGISFKVIGHQWYWSYSFLDKYFFDSYIVNSSLRLIDVDNRIVLPCFLPVRVLGSSCDVIHSWAIPSLGLKIDCIPGRINQICFSINRRGIFFGQCSEICGINHSFIPIVVESLPFKDFFRL